MLSKLAAEIWRDFEDDGNPSSEPWEPEKADIRQWAAVAEGVFNQNAWTDIASAATTDLSSGSATAYNITGTTPITSFGAGVDLLRWIKFAGILTLTHSASLSLPGGLDLITDAGGRGLAISDTSGNWTLLFYAPAHGHPLTTRAASLVSAATVDLGSKLAKAIIITGATGPITSFGTAAPIGTTKFIEFTGTPTLINSASLILPYGANLTVEAGGCMLATYESAGVWRAHNYLDATAAATRARLFTPNLVAGVNSDIASMTALASLDAGPIGGWRNLLINPHGRINQRAPATNADDTYGHDCWYALTQSNPIAVSTQSDVEDGTPKMMRLSQANASAQRMGYAQIIEGANCKHLRGRPAVLSGRVRLSSAANIRYAILEWTGTEDTVTSDVVADWTSSSYATNAFFLNSASLTVRAVGSMALSAATLTDLTILTATLGSTFNNLILLVWTEATVAQNVTLDLAMEFSPGSVKPTYREVRPLEVELALCERYFQLNTSAAAYASSTTNIQTYFPFRRPMRATPSVAVFAGTNGADDPAVAQRNISAVGSTINTGTLGSAVNLTIASSTNGKLHFVFPGAISFDASL